MTREEMLTKLGLTEAQHVDLMNKFSDFFQNLDGDQKNVVRQNLPSLEQAAKSFGPDVSVDDFKQFIGDNAMISGAGCMGGNNQ